MHKIYSSHHNCLLVISAILLSVTLTRGCQHNGWYRSNDDTKYTNSAFHNPSDALQQTKKRLHLVLNDYQRKAFGLNSEAEIMQLEVLIALPITYVAMNQLEDAPQVNSTEGYWYGLGNGGISKIGVSVQQSDGAWKQHSIGMKTFVNATNKYGNVTRLVEIPGLEMSFLALADEQRTVYTPIADYKEAMLLADSLYSWDELRRSVSNYRTVLERKLGDGFIIGRLFL